MHEPGAPRFTVTEAARTNPLPNTPVQPNQELTLVTSLFVIYMCCHVQCVNELLLHEIPCCESLTILLKTTDLHKSQDRFMIFEGTNLLFFIVSEKYCAVKSLGNM